MSRAEMTDGRGGMPQDSNLAQSTGEADGSLRLRTLSPAGLVPGIAQDGFGQAHLEQAATTLVVYNKISGTTGQSGERACDSSMPSARTYRGDLSAEIHHHSFKRGFTDFTYNMRLVYPGTPSIDNIIEGRIEQAKKNGRDVVGIDLGAGVGNFTRQFLAEPTVGTRSRRRLAGQSVKTQVRFYSVTDSPSVQDHMQIKPFLEAKNPGNEQITGQEVNYSITTSQSIKKLLEGLEKNSADIIVASNFMQYLHPQLFERVLQDIIDVLEPGGQFMAFGYATLAGRHLSIDDDYVPEDKPVRFKDPKKLDDEGITGEELRSWGQDLLAHAQTTDDQFRDAVDRIQKIMFASDYYAKSELDNFRHRIKVLINKRKSNGEPLRGTFAHILNDVLPLAEDQVRIETIQAEKDKILNTLRERNADVALVEYQRIPNEEQGFEAIIIKKRIEGSRMKKRRESRQDPEK